MELDLYELAEQYTLQEGLSIYAMAISTYAAIISTLVAIIQLFSWFTTQAEKKKSRPRLSFDLKPTDREDHGVYHLQIVNYGASSLVVTNVLNHNKVVSIPELPKKLGPAESVTCVIPPSTHPKKSLRLKVVDHMDHVWRVPTPH